MNLFILTQYKLIRRLYRDSNYMDILMNVEDFLDLLNVYAFPNWRESEVVNLDFKKYYTFITLKSPYNKMPHPKFSIILTKFDCIVTYRETTELVPVDVKDIKDTYIDPKSGERKPKVKKQKCWLVEIGIPSKHIINNNVYDLESIQDKLEDDDTEDENMENVVSNNDDEFDEMTGDTAPQSNNDLGI